MTNEPTAQAHIKGPLTHWQSPERLGMMAAALMMLPVGALALLPLSLPKPPAPITPYLSSGAGSTAFIDKAPFDPLHRRETSVAPLLAGDGQVQAPVKKPLMISAILMIGQERKVAFDSQPDVWHTEGEEIDGWLIRHIEPESVILTRGADILTPTYREALEAKFKAPLSSP